MKNLMEDCDTIQNTSSLDKGSLAGVHHFIGNQSKARCKPFCEEPKAHIDDSNGAELPDIVCTLDFGKKGQNPVVQTFHVNSTERKLLDQIHELGPH